MSGRDMVGHEAINAPEEPSGAELLRPLVEAPRTWPEQATFAGGVVVGELVGFRDEGRTPLVLYTGQPSSAAVAARSVVDLDGAQIGRRVVLMFEGADAARPIVMGVLRAGEGAPLAEQPGQVEVDADGERLIVSAKEQLVLRCGKASITLTKAGKVLIQGSYVLSRSSGVNRVKGGSVQLN
jgi:hypothetical protein